jgi:hypothetical protein
MAIDTSDKRKSALQYQSPSIFALPTSDSSIVELDRRQIAKVYRSLFSLIPSAAESDSEVLGSALNGSLTITPEGAAADAEASASVSAGSVLLTPAIAAADAEASASVSAGSLAFAPATIESESDASATLIQGSIAVALPAAESENSASLTVVLGANETVAPPFATVESSLSATAIVAEQTITTAKSVYKQALERFAKQISNLEETLAFFPGTPDVQVRKLDWDDIVKQNGVSVRYQRDSVQFGAGNNSTDFWGYPLHVVIVQERQMQLSDEPQLLLSKIRRTYNHTQKLGVPLEGVCSSATVVRKGPRVPRDKLTQNAFRDKDIYTMTVVAWFDEQ